MTSPIHCVFRVFMCWHDSDFLRATMHLMPHISRGIKQHSYSFLQGFLGIPIDLVERAVAELEGDLEAAVDSLLARAERQSEQETVTPTQTHAHLNYHHQQTPPQQNGHTLWQNTPPPPGKPMLIRSDQAQASS